LTRPYGTVKAIEERNAYRKRLTAKSKTRNTNKLRLKTSWSTRRREEGRGEESGVRDSYASSSARARGFIYIAWMWFPFRDMTRMPLKLWNCLDLNFWYMDWCWKGHIWFFVKLFAMVLSSATVSAPLSCCELHKTRMGLQKCPSYCSVGFKRYGQKIKCNGFIWGATAYPFSTSKEKKLWDEENWTLKLLLDEIDPLLTTWVWY